MAPGQDDSDPRIRISGHTAVVGRRQTAWREAREGRVYAAINTGGAVCSFARGTARRHARPVGTENDVSRRISKDALRKVNPPQTHAASYARQAGNS